MFVHRCKFLPSRITLDHRFSLKEGDWSANKEILVFDSDPHKMQGPWKLFSGQDIYNITYRVPFSLWSINASDISSILLNKEMGPFLTETSRALRNE